VNSKPVFPHRKCSKIPDTT